MRQILKIKDGRVYILNETQKLTDIIERNSLFPLGTFIPYNFSNLTDVPIPGESVDLVICLMGLHHLPQDQLPIFLKMIYRILRPNGLFLFREHHAHEGLKPLLDVAHMVFNAVTRVDYQAEIKEIRAFRTIEQWRSCLRDVGFVDTFIYDEQEDDPTDDIMIVMRKPEVVNPDVVDENDDIEKEDFQRIIAAPESNYFRPCEWLVVRITNHFASYLNHTPFFLFPYMKYLSIYWSLFRTETEFAISKFGVKTAVMSSVGFLMDSVIGILITGAFIQLSFFSFLIRLTGGVRNKPEYEQIVIDGLEENFDFENLIDPQIDDVQPLRKSGRYAIRVRRHRAFTATLKKLAFHPNRLTLISISNLQDQIQVELIVHNGDEERLLWLKQRSNQEIIYEYKNPTDQTQIILFIAVQIKYLFSFLRDCQPFEQDHSLTIVQIHDYYD